MSDKYFFHVKKERPEDIHKSVVEYYDENRCREYARSKNMMRIQRRITNRALELLEIMNDNPVVLDAGCGPGFSSLYLNELNYKIVALDLIPYFFRFNDLKEFNPINADMCALPFKSNVFDGILSISALQWIFRDVNNQKMKNDLINLINSFFYVLKPKCRALIQFYPKNSLLMDNIGKLIVNNSNFEGNYIIDNPKNPKKRKIYLLLEKKLP